MKAKKLVIAFALLTVLSAMLLSGCSSQEESSDLLVEENPVIGEKSGQPSEEKMVAQTALVVIKDFKFSPQKITVKKGTVVTWRNEDSAPHTVESSDGRYTSDNLEKTDNVQFTFDKAGAVDYICGIHPSMKGSVIVEE